MYDIKPEQVLAGMGLGHQHGLKRHQDQMETALAHVRLYRIRPCRTPTGRKAGSRQQPLLSFQLPVHVPVRPRLASSQPYRFRPKRIRPCRTPTGRKAGSRRQHF